jgi:hypothetical protein
LALFFTMEEPTAPAAPTTVPVSAVTPGGGTVVQGQGGSAGIGTLPSDAMAVGGSGGGGGGAAFGGTEGPAGGPPAMGRPGGPGGAGSRPGGGGPGAMGFETAN